MSDGIDPDQRAISADLRDARFRIGVLEGRWGLAPDEAVSWPHVVLWVAAAPRAKAPDRYYFREDCTGYPSDAPTGSPWDVQKRAMLEHPKWPGGTGQVAKVFRPDWENGRAIYHPYDRVAAAGHENWRTQHPHLIWDANHTIVDLLEQLHLLLNSEEYAGVRG